MRAQEIFDAIEALAPLRYQESYDNSGLQIGDAQAEVTGVLLCTDVTESVIDEAIARRYNVVMSHHPLIFGGLKRLTGATRVERIVATAVKHDIIVYCAHTNMDNTSPRGVSFKMAEKLGLVDVDVLDPHRDAVLTDAADARVYGSGVVGTLREPAEAAEVLQRAKSVFGTGTVRFSGDPHTTVSRVALCGGAGVFLVGKAIDAGAQLLITGDVKYHDFQAHESDIVLADIGHYESEQYTKEIFFDIIQKKTPTFAVAFAKQERNPINYI